MLKTFLRSRFSVISAFTASFQVGFETLFIPPQQKFTLSFCFYICHAFHLWICAIILLNEPFLFNSGPLCCDFVLLLQRRGYGSSKAKVESSILPASGEQLHGNSSIGKISRILFSLSQGRQISPRTNSSVICTIAFRSCYTFCCDFAGAIFLIIISVLIKFSRCS